MPERYEVYEKRLRIYIRWHMICAGIHTLLYLLPLLLFTGALVVRAASPTLPLPGPGLIAVSLLAALLFALLGSIFLRKYLKEIAQLRAGRLTIETGTVMEKMGKRYLIDTCLPDRRKKGQPPYAPKLFLIQPRKREREFSIGDQVTVVHAATPLLQSHGFPEWRYGLPTHVIYAFTGDVAGQLPPVRSL